MNMRHVWRHSLLCAGLLSATSLAYCLGAEGGPAESKVTDSSIVNAFDDYAYEPSHENFRIFNSLLKAGGNPNALRYGNPLLFDVPTVEMAKALIAAGADAKQVDEYGKTVLNGDNAGRLDVIKALLAAGADPHQASEFGMIPLHSVCKRSFSASGTPDPEAAERIALLRPEKASVDVLARASGTPLLESASQNNPDCVKALIAAGASLDAALYSEEILEDLDLLPGFKRSLRHHVLRQANVILNYYDDETINIFKTVGVQDPALVRDDPDAKVIRAFSTYYREPSLEHMAAFRELLDAGGNPDALRGYRPLLFDVPNAEIANVLIAAGADVKLQLRNGDTVLNGSNAANLDVIKVLLAAGADPLAMTNKGITPLHNVCGLPYRNRPDPEAAERIALLRPQGGSLDGHYPHASTRSWVGTPLMQAVFTVNHDCIKALIAAGADPDAQAYPDKLVEANPETKGSVLQQVLQEARKHPNGFGTDVLKLLETHE